MGLAASQARLLTVTSRLSDIEYKQQQISNMKMRMSVENEQIANDYSEALNNQTLELNDGTGQVAFTYDNLVNAGYGVMKTSDGNTLSTTEQSNTNFIIQGLLSGYLTLTDSSGSPVSLDSNTAITTVYDKTDDAKAEAEYEAAMSKLNRKEKQLDNQMSELDTEYSALTTEYESIKSIISTHASKDFELFS